MINYVREEPKILAELGLKTGRTTTVKVHPKVRLGEPRKLEWISLDLAGLLPSCYFWADKIFTVKLPFVLY
jgi:hypothetical protein